MPSKPISCVSCLSQRALVALPVLGILLLSCSQPEPVTMSHPPRDSWVRIVGVIAPDLPGYPALASPDTVSVGTTFSITVTTFGGSGCIRPDRSDVQVNGSIVDIVARDSIWGGPEPCLPDWHPYPRAVDISLSSSGQYLIRLHGRAPPDSAATRERFITVQ